MILDNAGDLLHDKRPVTLWVSVEQDGKTLCDSVVSVVAGDAFAVQRLVSSLIPWGGKITGSPPIGSTDGDGRCGYCLAEISYPNDRIGRPRRYCSDACRQNANRAVKRAHQDPQAVVDLRWQVAEIDYPLSTPDSVITHPDPKATTSPAIRKVDKSRASGGSTGVAFDWLSENLTTDKRHPWDIEIATLECPHLYSIGNAATVLRALYDSGVAGRLKRPGSGHCLFYWRLPK